MTFFMLELPAQDPLATAAWYCATLGMGVTKSDPATGFVLLDGLGLQLAFKPGTPQPAGIALHFQVENFDTIPGPVKQSPEGYERKKLTDPNGYAIILFRWTTPR